MTQNSLSVRMALLFMAATFLIGGKAAFAGDDKVVLRLWEIPHKYAWRTADKAERAIYEKFRVLHPEIEIVSSTGIKLEGQASIDSVFMSIAAGTAPHVIYVNFRKSTTYVEQNFLYPLDEYWEDELNVKIHPDVWPIIKQKGPDGKEHIYTLPYGRPIVGSLMYRKDLFKEAGLNPYKPPRDWDEFYEYARRLRKPEKGEYGWATEVGIPGAYTFCNFIYMAGGKDGGKIVERQEDGSWRAVYNNAAGVEALRFYHKLLRDGLVSKDINDWHDGRAGMSFRAVQGDTLFDTAANPEIIGIAPLPLGPEGRRGGEFNQRMLGISSAITDKRVRDAAWKYIKFIASDEADRIMSEVFVKAGEGRFLNPVLLRKFGYDEVLKEVPQGWIEAHEKSMEHINPEPYGRNCDMIYRELQYPVEYVGQHKDVDYHALLDKAVMHTNEKLIGEIPADKLKQRRWIVAVVMLVLALVFVFFFVKFIIIMMQKVQESTAIPGGSIVHGKTKWLLVSLFMLPALLTILIWQYYPLFRGLVIAFLDYRIMGGTKFVGIDNFVTIFWQPEFWIAMKNTFIYVFLTIAMGFFLPVILALMLNEIPRGTLFFRTVYYLPAITSPVVIMLLWKQFYEPSPVGLMNQLIGILGIPAQRWLENINLAMICVIIPGIWAGLGASSIVYLAALKNVPEELYETATLDGAGIFQKIWYVTIPRIKILLIINFVGAFIGAFHATERILVMTGGGPLLATHVIGLEIFYSAFVYVKFGLATAMAWILGALLIGFTVYQLKILRKVSFTTVR